MTAPGSFSRVESGNGPMPFTPPFPPSTKRAKPEVVVPPRSPSPNATKDKRKLTDLLCVTQGKYCMLSLIAVTVYDMHAMSEGSVILFVCVWGPRLNAVLVFDLQLWAEVLHMKPQHKDNLSLCSNPHVTYLQKQGTTKSAVVTSRASSTRFAGVW